MPPDSDQEFRNPPARLPGVITGRGFILPARIRPEKISTGIPHVVAPIAESRRMVIGGNHGQGRMTFSELASAPRSCGIVH
jgi:hypothetical protein